MKGSSPKNPKFNKVLWNIFPKNQLKQTLTLYFFLIFFINIVNDMHHQCDYKKIQACINKNHKVYMGSKD